MARVCDESLLLLARAGQRVDHRTETSRNSADLTGRLGSEGDIELSRSGDVVSRFRQALERLGKPTGAEPSEQAGQNDDREQHDGQPAANTA